MFLQYYVSKLSYILSVINYFLFKDEPVVIKKTTTEELTNLEVVSKQAKDDSGSSRIYEQHSPSTKEKISLALKGRQHTPEQNKRLSISGKRYYSNPANRKKMQDIAVRRGLTIPVRINKKLYCSMSEAARQLNLSVSSVKLRCGSLNWYSWNFTGKDKIVKPITNSSSATSKIDL